MEQENPGSAIEAKQGRNVTGGEPRELWWAEASIWTDRMVSALGNGVKGGKWFSLIDKVVRPSTLEAAWQRVARNKGQPEWMAKALRGSLTNRNGILWNFTRS